jgi:hypothetical protein
VGLVSTLYAQFAPNFSPDMSLEDSLKEESFVQIAYSNRYYNNVGILCYANFYKNETSFDVMEQGGSAVYIGGRLCLSAAHCCRGHSKFKIGFEGEDRQKVYYDVLECILHPQYKKNSNSVFVFDIAILVLDRTVAGLEGLKPCYIFKKEQGYVDYLCLTTNVGYGLHNFAFDWLQNEDGQRRAIRSYLDFLENKEGSLMLYTAPYGYLTNWEEKRKLLPFEGASRQGMSGGAIFHDNLGLIGIHVGSKFYIEKRTYLIYFYLKMSQFLNIFFIIYYNLFDHFLILSNSIRHESICGTSVSLATCKDWIEEHRVKYGMDDMV